MAEGGPSESATDGPAAVGVRAVLQREHRFLREEDSDESDEADDRWEKRMAKRFEAELYKDFALADLSRCSKRFPGKNIGLRWRTESEVCRYKGETVCGNLRCARTRRLAAVEVPFSYQEHGKRKEAMVKLKLCDRCLPYVRKESADEVEGESARARKDKRDRSSESPPPRRAADAKRRRS
jgi:protein FRA10AC1